MEHSFKRTLLLALLAVCTCISASAYDFKVDGIYYNKIGRYQAYHFDVDGNKVNDSLYQNAVAVAPLYSDNSSNSAAYEGDIVVPETVTYDSVSYTVCQVANYAFQYCAAVNSVVLPSTVKVIGHAGFKNCSSLTSIEMPGVTVLNGMAFYNCSSLESISIAEGCNSIGYYFAAGCSNLKSVNLPSTFNSIGDYVFEGCTSLENVNLPDNVTSLGSRVFNGCTSLSSVTMPAKLKSMGNNVFCNCKALTAMTLPVGVESIGESAFYNCTALESINFPEGVTTIGQSAFYNCNKLSSVSLPASLVYIGNNAFFGTSVTAYSVADGNTHYAAEDGVLYNAGITQLVAYPTAKQGEYTIPSTVTAIGSNAFYGANCITKLTIPNSVKSIGSQAFCNASNIGSICISDTTTWLNISFADQYANPLAYADSLCVSGKLLTTLNVPESINSIGQYAFYNYDRLYKVSLTSDSPLTITNTSFNSETCFFVPESAVDTYNGASVWSSMADRIFAAEFFETNAMVTATDGESALLAAIGGADKLSNIVSLKVNGTINGYDIMLMRNKLTNLRYLDLSEATIVAEKDNYEYYTGCHTEDSVLGAYSFYDVDNLRTVVLPQKITSIGERAFALCDKLTEVTGMPSSCKIIGYGAFCGGFYWYGGIVGSLKNVTIGNGVETISSWAFANSTILKVTIPASVKSIEDCAFHQCRKLTEITFEEGLETIGGGAFYDCYSLKELRLPPTLKRLEGSAFNKCSALTEIHMPSSLEYVGGDAFTGCSAAKAVYTSTLTPISISQNSFTYDGVTLYAPQEPDNVYKDYFYNTQWSQFTNVKPYTAQYTSWYTGEDADLIIGDEETIPNVDDEDPAEGEMNPGSGIIMEGDAWQKLKELILKWSDGKNYPSLIDNGNMDTDKLTFQLTVNSGRWYFFCFPFDIDLSNVKYTGRSVWRYYPKIPGFYT